MKRRGLVSFLPGTDPSYPLLPPPQEMIHRPPYMAKHLFHRCKAPFRQCMICAPRCYCMLSHYPFFDLHFQVRSRQPTLAAL